MSNDTSPTDAWLNTPSAETVRADVHFSLEELHAARRFWYRHRMWARTRVPPTFLATATFAAGAMVLQSRFLLLITVGLTILYFWQAYQRSWTWLCRLYLRDPELLSPFAIEFSPEGVLVRRGGQHMWVGWGRIEEVIESRDSFLVCDTPAPLERFVLVPLHTLLNPADCERVRDLARTYCKYSAL